MKRSACLSQAMLLWLGLAAPVWSAEQTTAAPAAPRERATAAPAALRDSVDKAQAQNKPAADKQTTPAPDKPAKPLPDKPGKPAPDKPGAAKPAGDKDKVSRISVPLAPTPEELQRQRQAQKQAADAREDPNRQGRGRLPTQVRNTLGPGNNVGTNSNQARKDAIQDASGPSGARTPIP